MLRFINFFFQFNPRNTDVQIESPSLNSRRITASIVINAPISNVWAILTDYNNLATHVPNLIQSYLVPDRAGRVLLFQEGAQKIIGFNFRASLTMQMTEQETTEAQAQNTRRLDFTCIESAMFNDFEGSWSVNFHSRVREFDKSLNKFILKDRSKLTYSVLVRPRGPVPVFALEWRIKEDVPVNLWAVKMAAERLPQIPIDASAVDDNNDSGSGDRGIGMESAFMRQGSGWEVDETLSSYMGGATSSSTQQKQLIRGGSMKSQQRIVSGISPLTRTRWQPGFGQA